MWTELPISLPLRIKVIKIIKKLLEIAPKAFFMYTDAWRVGRGKLFPYSIAQGYVRK